MPQPSLPQTTSTAAVERWRAAPAHSSLVGDFSRAVVYLSFGWRSDFGAPAVEPRSPPDQRLGYQKSFDGDQMNFRFLRKSKGHSQLKEGRRSVVLEPLLAIDAPMRLQSHQHPCSIPGNLPRNNANRPKAPKSTPPGSMHLNANPRCKPPGPKGSRLALRPKSVAQGSCYPGSTGRLPALGLVPMPSGSWAVWLASCWRVSKLNELQKLSSTAVSSSKSVITSALLYTGFKAR
jgi:hypothetical protein